VTHPEREGEDHDGPNDFRVVMCAFCKHWIIGGGCDAFVDGRPPWPIVSGERLHETPFEGDGGKMFEPAPGLEVGAAAMRMRW
jgi:hypothetical protein